MTIDEAITTEIEYSQPCDIICKDGADCNDCRSYHRQLVEWLEELKQYRAVGAVEECREAMEKQKAKNPRPIDYKKYIGVVENAKALRGLCWCPNCHQTVASGSFCKNCGQKLDWGDEE